MTTAAEEASTLPKSSADPNDGDEANLQPLTSTSSNTPPEPYISSISPATLTSCNNVTVMTRHAPTVAAADPAILAILPASADAIGGNATISSSSTASSAEADDDRGEEGACAQVPVQYRYPLKFLLQLKEAPLSQAKPTALLATSGSGISGTSTAPSLLLSCFIDAPGQSSGEPQQTSRWASNSGGRGGNNNDRGDRDRDTGRGGRGGGDRSERLDGGRGGERGEGAGLMTRGGGGIGGLAGQDIRLEPDGYRRRPGDPQRRSFNTGCFVPVTNNSSSRRTHSPTPPGSGGTTSGGGGGGSGKLTNEQSDRTIGGSSDRDRDREGGRRIGSGRILAYMDKSGGGGPGQEDEGGYGGGYSSRRDSRRGGDMDRVDMDRYDRRNLFTRNNTSAHPNNSSSDYDNANTSSNNSDNNRPNNNNNTNNSNHSNKSNSRTIISNRYDLQQQQQHSSYQQRGHNRRIMDAEEPEWFSSGPISQHDTIELRGFDDGDKTPKKQRQTAQAQKKKSTGTMSNNSSNSVANNRNSSLSTSTVTGKENESSSPNTKADVDRSVSSGNVDKQQRGSPNSQKGQLFGDDKKVSSGPGDREVVRASSNLVHNDDLNNSFNLDEILKLDMPDVLANGVESVGGSTTSASRFSRWFQQNKSPPPRIDSPQQQRQHHQVADDYLHSLMADADNQHGGGVGAMLLNQQTFANIQQHNMTAFPQSNQALHITAPGDSASYFAPISPASTAGIHQQQHNYQQHPMHNQHYQQQQHHQQQQANMLADMLQGRGNSGSGSDVRRSVLGVATPPGSKVFSLEELEGNIKGAAAMMMSQQQQQQKHAMHHRAQHQHVATAQQQQPPPPPPPPPQQNNQQQQSKGGEDVDAFKRMMEQAGHGLTNGPLTKSSNQQNASNSNNMNSNAISSKPPPTLMELLAQSQSSAQSAGGDPQSEMSQQHFPTAASHYATKQQQQQIEFHLKQQQQQLLNSMIYNSQQQQPGGRISPDMRNACREIVQRPETQALLQGLKRGEISTAQIYQQLNTPTLQARQRDALQIALKLHTSSTTTSTTPQSGSMTQPQPATNQPVQHAAVSQQQQLPPPPVIGAGVAREGAVLTSPGGGAASPQPHHVQQGQVMWNQQLRLSPLPPQGVNPFCVSPILATSPNTLGVPALHKRIPSPYELQVHTQNIMQRALIKKKLEEQQENYRKKQEAAASTGTGRDLSPSTNLPSSNPSTTSNSSTAISTSSPVSSGTSVQQQQSLASMASNMQQQQQSHHKAAASPTPTIAFTPTSVLRKMTADKDEATMTAMLNAAAAKMQPGRAVIGNLRAQQQQSGNISSPWGLFQQGNKPVGRPIVKSTQNNPGSSYPGQQQQQPQSTLMSNQQQQEQFFQQQQRLLQQQQQQHKWNQYYSQQQQTQQQQQMFMNAGQQQMTPQQLRAQQQNIRAQHQHQQGGGNQPGQGGNQQQQGQQGWAAMFDSNQHQQHHRAQHQQQSNHQPTVHGRDNNPAGGDLSPTSNQLAKWFSPDLLERARNGKCPVLPNPALAKRALNLEDVEQQRRRNSASITGGGGHSAAGDN